MNLRIIPRRIISVIATLGCAVGISSCATTTPKQQQVEAPVSAARQAEAQRQVAAVAAKTLKRKIAIGRFTNETRYGKALLTDQTADPLGKQVSDILASRLVASQKFLVFERPDLDKIKAEQTITRESGLIGVDALVIGSLTEFGRSTTGKSGFLSGTKVQTAHAKVELRLVDVKSGLVFFTASGTGEATTESGEIAGYGSKADYDSTLNDRAIAAAITDVQNALIGKLDERPWHTDILKVEGHQVYISGGTRQGLKVGDVLAISMQGERVKSQQTGFEIMLPAKVIGSIRVSALFGDNETNEGAIAEIVSGNISDANRAQLSVGEPKE